MRQIRIAFDLYPLHKYDEHIVDCNDKKKALVVMHGFAAITLLYLCVYSLCTHKMVRDEQKVKSGKLEISVRTIFIVAISGKTIYIGSSHIVEFEFHNSL